MAQVTDEQAVQQVRDRIAAGAESADSYRARMQQFEQEMLEMRVTGQYGVLRYSQAEWVVKVLRQALDLPAFPEPVQSVFEDAVLIQSLELGYDPDAKRRDDRYMTCRRCGQDGYVGSYPFSTAPSTGLCDDCL